MALLQLAQVTVERERASAVGSDPVPDGTHVWLDVPGGDFEWNHFTVTNGRLVPDQGSTPIPLDTRWRHWCIWSPAALTVPNGDFQPVGGAFGGPATTTRWPLPSRFERRAGASVLVLPNTRSLHLRTFDLCFGKSKSKAGDLSVARTFYDRLLIDLVEDAQATPTDPNLKLPWINTRFDGKKALFMDFGPGAAPFELKVQPDLGKAPFAPTADPLKTILVVWMREFVNIGVGGMALAEAFPVLRTVATATSPTATSGIRCDPGKHPFVGQTYALPAGPVVFMRDERPVAATNAFAHELAHCLTHDAGMGRRQLEDSGGKAAMLTFLAGLGVEGPPPAGKRPGETLWDDLYPVDAHSTLARNLMARTGGDQLRPWQVAVMRAARELEP